MRNKVLFRFERVFLLLAIIGFFLFIALTKGYRQNNNLKRPTPFVRQPSLTTMISKIQGSDSWKPKGFGSGEYLENLPRIRAGAVVDLVSGEVIWSMNLKQKIAPASLTKVATVMTALDITNVDYMLSVDEDASSQIPTKLGLSVGEKLTLSEAISAALLTSANDATETISESLGKEFGDGTPTFVKLVNEKLKKIGAVDSNFETSTGLDSAGHYSTIYDLAIIGHEAKANYPVISNIASQQYLRLEANGNHKVFDLPNWNALLGTYPGVNGLKIGYTEESGHSTMVTAERDGKKLIAIVVGTNSIEDRENAAATLLNYGFSKSGIEPFPINELNLVNRFEDWRRQLSYKSDNLNRNN